MFITPVLKVATYKLGTMVDSVRWNDTTDMLAAMIDQRLVVWYYPNVVYVDKDLTARWFARGGGGGRNTVWGSFAFIRCHILFSLSSSLSHAR